MAEAAAKIIGVLSSEATKVALNSVPLKTFGDSLQEKIKDKTSDLKNLFKR